MKPSAAIFAILSSVSLAVAGEIGGPKEEEKLSRGPLPLHQLPECWQGCLQSENHWYRPDINKVSVYYFCVDPLFDTRFWSLHALATCTYGACSKAEHYVAQDWYFEICQMN
ncbi:hypothetical protein CaCOL14_008335 [Colletotrichum acutatum]|uniref:Uncharacterized protein n=1 Tax=Glomerella acutata TaxID=27357 RepID=A0AAD8X7P2_GLOAC|nr:uncharacterized protein BDZ83DRAFT_658242 [Colletotrichum acutatum]KAK1704659.1 hypothetical protein BDZ83DRAFT_658242 [Colletotrichum acutatum]